VEERKTEGRKDYTEIAEGAEKKENSGTRDAKFSVISCQFSV
jgi:hypothetical protein